MVHGRVGRVRFVRLVRKRSWSAGHLETLVYHTPAARAKRPMAVMNRCVEHQRREDMYWYIWSLFSGQLHPRQTKQWKNTSTASFWPQRSCGVGLCFALRATGTRRETKHKGIVLTKRSRMIDRQGGVMYYHNTPQNPVAYNTSSTQAGKRAEHTLLQARATEPTKRPRYKKAGGQGSCATQNHNNIHTPVIFAALPNVPPTSPLTRTLAPAPTVSASPVISALVLVKNWTTLSPSFTCKPQKRGGAAR